MAKPYREGDTWSFRLRVQGQDIYRCGFKTSAEATKTQEEVRSELCHKDKAAGRGPFNTTLAQAFSQYAKERLPFLKGAPADSIRINRYLRAMAMPIIKLKRISAPSDAANVYWDVQFKEEGNRIIPNSLKAHRANQASTSQASDDIRRQLAGLAMAEVTTTLVQKFISTLATQGYGSNTIALERAELRRVFNHARDRWHWTRPARNPASSLDMPNKKIKRNKLISNSQWEKMAAALCDGGNDYAPYLFCLMLETAMRSCEPLTYARWEHIDWSRRVLALPDAKAGEREVPLGPGAIVILAKLMDMEIAKAAKKKRAWNNEGPLFPTTYEAVKKAWKVAREACGFGDIRMHDLRHTSTTRYALQLKGDLPKIMAITGHKTTTMAIEYTHITADNVVAELHGEELPIESAPAGYMTQCAKPVIDALDENTTPFQPPLPPSQLSPPSNIVFGRFGRRAA